METETAAMHRAVTTTLIELLGCKISSPLALPGFMDNYYNTSLLTSPFYGWGSYTHIGCVEGRGRGGYAN